MLTRQPKRRHPEKRTVQQLAVLATYWQFWTGRGPTPRRHPTLGDLARALGAKNRWGMQGHVYALMSRGDLEPRPEKDTWQWARWRLTAQGRKRAKARYDLIARQQKRKAARDITSGKVPSHEAATPPRSNELPYWREDPSRRIPPPYGNL